MFKVNTVSLKQRYWNDYDNYFISMTRPIHFFGFVSKHRSVSLLHLIEEGSQRQHNSQGLIQVNISKAKPATA